MLQKLENIIYSSHVGFQVEFSSIENGMDLGLSINSFWTPNLFLSQSQSLEVSSGPSL